MVLITYNLEITPVEETVIGCDSDEKIVPREKKALV